MVMDQNNANECVGTGMSNKKERTYHSFDALGEARAQPHATRHGKQTDLGNPYAESPPASPANGGSPSNAGNSSKKSPAMRPVAAPKRAARGMTPPPAQGIDPADASLFLAAMAAVTPAEYKHAKSHSPRHPHARKHTAAGTAAPVGASMGDDERLFLAATTRFGQPLGPLAPEPETVGSGKKKQHDVLPGLQPAAQGAGFSGQQGESALWAREAGGEEAITTEEDSLFSKAMQGVAPVTTRGRQVHGVAGKKGGTAAGQAAAFAMADFLAGRVEFTLAHTGEYLEGFVKGTDPIVMEKLRAGVFSPEAHVDLHGQNAQQAYDSLLFFMKNAYQRNLRCVLVITGRGKNSPDGVGVIRPQLQSWLTRDPCKRVVLAFCTAKPGDGGPGAVYVLLRKFKKSRGKIMWERLQAHDDFIDC